MLSGGKSFMETKRKMIWPKEVKKKTGRCAIKKKKLKSNINSKVEGQT
jgi:hypothetical protein